MTKEDQRHARPAHIGRSEGESHAGRWHLTRRPRVAHLAYCFRCRCIIADLSVRALKDPLDV